LVVGDFVFGAGAGFGGRDVLAGDRIEDRNAHAEGVGAGDAGEGNFAAGGHAVKHVVAAVASGGDAAEEIFVAGENGFGGFPNGDIVLLESEFVEDEVAAKAARGAWVGGEYFDAAFAALDFDADFRGEEVEFDGAGFGFENCAVFGADGLAFLGEFGAVLLAVAEDGDEAAGTAEEAVNGPGGEDGAFAELTRPMEAEDSGGVVGEDRDLIGTKFHALTVRSHRAGRKNLCRSSTTQWETLTLKVPPSDFA
jgi:hypothetical protein